MSIRINGNSGRKPQKITGPVDRDVKKVTEKNSLQFSTHMDKNYSDNQEERLKKKALEIEKQGKRLGKHIDVAELKAYKRLVMEFLDEAARGSTSISKDSFLDRRGRHRVFASIKIINEKLEQLTKDVLSSEKDNLTILGRIEDIRGLILDLVL